LVILSTRVYHKKYRYSSIYEYFQESPSDESLDFSKQYESTSFSQAARDGDCQIIQQKIKNQYRGGKRKYLKRDINLLDSMKLAPLHYAAKVSYSL
jgi:hypothetical protein